MKTFAIAFMAITALFCMFVSKPVKADTVATTTFATGALALGPHGSVTTLAGISHQVVGVPAFILGAATLGLDGFIGAGTTSVTGVSSYGAGLYPSISVGSLSVGVGLYYDAKNSVAHGMAVLSFSL